jgi:XRE family aerobic/anaerobic benzoate catabolism transcriptional regulator
MLYTACMPKPPARQLKVVRPKSVIEPEPQGSDAEFLAGLGSAVREARSQRGMSRKVLAQTAKVSERYLAHLELGAGNASIVLLRKIATALGVALPALLEYGAARPEQKMIRRFLDGLSSDRLEEVLQRLTKEFGQEEQVRRKRITLIGLRGAGKTTLGKALAKDLRRPFVELDREIEREAGMSLSEVFLLYGQPGYRRIERRCLERIINNQEDIVLTVGGGMVSEAETYDLLLLNCFTVWVKAAPEEHMARVVAQGDTRPMSGHSEAMQDLRDILTAREPMYGKADLVLDTAGKSVEKSFEALKRALLSADR